VEAFQRESPPRCEHAFYPIVKRNRCAAPQQPPSREPATAIPLAAQDIAATRENPGRLSLVRRRMLAHELFALTNIALA
jgi:hypothetical protein